MRSQFGNRARALIVEPPAGTVGQHPPPQLAGGQILHPPQIAEHLGRGRGFLAAPAGLAIEWPLPALGFDEGETEPVALPLFRKGVGFRLCRRVGKQQAVRHIVPALGRQVLLSQALGPAELAQHLPDQIILGLTLIRGLICRKRRKNAAQIGGNPFYSGIGKSLPVGVARDRFV